METLPVAVVVVNLDGGAMLEACLDALESNAPAVTVVVDNGSGAAELVRLDARAGLRLVRNPDNRGFAGPANAGLEAALAERSVPYVTFVNNDCVLAPGYLAACLVELERDAGLAAAQGVVLDGDAYLVDGCGIAWAENGTAVQLRHGEAPPPESEPAFAIPGVSATAGVFRIEAFRAAGGFEESFFAYYEDVDLSLRLARAGARFACVPAARATHLGSATGRRAPQARWRRLFTNRARTLRRNLAPAARPGAFAPGLRAAAKELGWARALAAAAGALAPGGGRRDREVFEALPPLSKLPS
jgi:GT2 family glycosyltransferase